MVMHTSEIRWYVPGTYGYDEPEGNLHNRMAFPPPLAQDWMIEFLRADRPLALESLFWRAYVYAKGFAMDSPLPEDLTPLDDFKIYVALLNRLTDRNWKTRFEAALARLRPKCNPIIIVGWCTDALPCS